VLNLEFIAFKRETLRLRAIWLALGSTLRKRSAVRGGRRQFRSPARLALCLYQLDCRVDLRFARGPCRQERSEWALPFWKANGSQPFRLRQLELREVHIGDSVDRVLPITALKVASRSGQQLR